MNEHRRGSHGVFEIHLPLARATKYRKPVLVGPVGRRAREPIREVCGAHDVMILEGHISEDHVPLLVSIPPKLTIGRLVRRLKGKTACKMLRQFAPPRREFRGRHPWARGYARCGSGNVTDAVMAAYIEHQGESGPGDFRVEHGDF